MWTVKNKPTLAEALSDIDPLVDHCNKLSDDHKPKLAILYRQYHQKGYATDVELAPLVSVKDDIKGQYSSKMTGSKTLGYVRKELNKQVTQCPMCSINETNQLDHYMNEATYGQLACCRLNLVPTCGVCNRLKSDDPYTDFVHAYYDRHPDVDFLITTITVKNNKVGLMFSIDKNALGNNDLARKTETQFYKLKLNDRLHKAGISFLNDYIGGLTCTTNKGLRTSLSVYENRLQTKYGRNDWRTSIIRGLKNSAAFDMTVVNAILAKNIVPVNGGGS